MDRLNFVYRPDSLECPLGKTMKVEISMWHRQRQVTLITYKNRCDYGYRTARAMLFLKIEEIYVASCAKDLMDFALSINETFPHPFYLFGRLGAWLRLIRDKIISRLRCMLLRLPRNKRTVIIFNSSPFV